jgi:hypothetical protein
VTLGQFVVVNDRMQRGYRYVLTEPVGRNFDPRFAPELTPKEMLKLGVFCGKYLTDTRGEFPEEWFTNAKLARANVIVRSISLGSTPASLCRYRGKRDGFIPTIRAAGFNGTAGTSWVAGSAKKTGARSTVGRRCAGMFGKSRSTARKATSAAANASARGCCTGPTTAVNYDRLYFRQNW